MSRISTFQKEMEEEAITTRKMLERVPADKFGWQPHPKSMSLGKLSAHVAELTGWVAITLHTDELDFAANPYQPHPIHTNGDLMGYFNKSLEEGRAALADAKEEELEKTWTMRAGDVVYSTRSKEEVIRMCHNQVVHHRAQLGVYLRLLDIPIPGRYGPSADEA